nr:NADH dehydrogenase subunit 3 [Moniliformis sp. XH-2020]
MLVLLVGLSMYVFSLVVMGRMIMIGEFLKSFECGFSSMSEFDVKISLRFYHMLVVFLLMDVEVIMLFFLPNILWMNMVWSLGLVVLMVVIYFVGLMYELSMGGLVWSK